MFNTSEEAIAAAIAAIGGGLIEFDGMNCNDYADDDGVECGGWDGVSRRCDCANRRVNWDVYRDDKTGYHVYAEAY